MDFRAILAAQLEIPPNKLVLLNKGLSTQKYLVQDLGQIDNLNSLAYLESPVLLRVYTRQSHGKTFLDVAKREMWVLENMVENAEVVYPRFIGQIVGEDYIANAVSWLEGKVPNNLDVAVNAWLRFKDSAKSFPVDSTHLPDHWKIVSHSFENLISLLGNMGLTKEKEQVEQIREKFIRKQHLVNACLIHGDFHLYNLIECEDGRIGIIDWEYVTIGNPFFDLLYSILYDYGLQNQTVQSFFVKRLEFASNHGVSGLDAQKLKYLGAIIFLLMAVWFFQRYGKTKREHNLQKGLVYLRGGLDLVFRF